VIAERLSGVTFKSNGLFATHFRFTKCLWRPVQDYASETETVRSIQGSAKKRFVAVLCIALAIAIWVTELEVTHDVIGHGPGQYDNAYALVWMSHNVSLFLGFGLGAVFACFAEVRNINTYAQIMN
jgi:hypothetical protein